MGNSSNGLTLLKLRWKTNSSFDSYANFKPAAPLKMEMSSGRGNISRNLFLITPGVITRTIADFSV